MRPFDLGRRAAKVGLSMSHCRMTGEEKKQWEMGFRSYVPEPEEDIDVERLGDEFLAEHLKDE